MRKKLFFIFIFLIISILFVGCNKNEESKDPITPGIPTETPINPDEPTPDVPVTPTPEVPTVPTPVIPEHTCEPGEWEFDKVYNCGSTGVQEKKCIICNEVMETRNKMFNHVIEREIVSPTCSEDGYRREKCKYCTFVNEFKLSATGHTEGDFKIIGDAKDGLVKRITICKECEMRVDEVTVANNGYFAHGKLSVVGPDLVDKDGEKVQLYGLSTHGMNWFGRYANIKTLANLQAEFGINVIRFAMYTEEDGYCSGDANKKRTMLEDLKEGIDAATKLGLYVIVDWHMVGAENPLDKNPLTFVNESMEFFTEIAKEYQNYDNILYEIMNEPNGDTTWSQCKQYANMVIPCIRNYTDAVVLVGNPKWTADLNSVMASPLTGYENIMYTYHFYAADHKNTTQVKTAYEKGFPVFISEFGMMLSSGDGALDTTAGEVWINLLDKYNISYVAWNISNSGGSASIFKEGSKDMYDVSDDNLKEWGVYLKKLYRRKAKLF